jgi:hypothetical protein
LHRIDAGIVDEDVAAAGALLDLPLQAGDALRIADVATDGLRPPALLISCRVFPASSRSAMTIRAPSSASRTAEA